MGLPHWPVTVALVVIFLIGLFMLGGQNESYITGRRKTSEVVGAILVLSSSLAFIAAMAMERLT